MVVSSAVTRHAPSSRNACSAIALSLPPLQQNSASCVTRASLMPRGVFHADAKFAPQRGKTVHLFILFIGEITNAAVNAEAARDVVGRRQIDQRISRVGHLS